MQAFLKIIGAECTVINRELGSKSAQRCWNRAAQYYYLYLQNNEVSYAPLISMYACLLYYSDLTLRAHRFVAKGCVHEINFCEINSHLINSYSINFS